LHPDKRTAQPELSRREFRQAQSRAAHPEQAKSSATLSFSRAPKAEKIAKRDRIPEPTYIPMGEDGTYQAFKSSGTGQRRL
jgi:hypothetical protein